jgi:hypothetical protein
MFKYLHITKPSHQLLDTHWKCSLTKFAKLLSTLTPSISRIESRRDCPPDPVVQLGWSISLDSALEKVSAFITVENSDPPALAIFFDSLERSRAFLLEYLNPEPLFFFLVSVEGTDLPKSFICSNFN